MPNGTDSKGDTPLALRCVTLSTLEDAVSMYGHPLGTALAEHIRRTQRESAIVIRVPVAEPEERTR